MMFQFMLASFNKSSPGLKLKTNSNLSKSTDSLFHKKNYEIKFVSQKDHLYKTLIFIVLP